MGNTSTQVCVVGRVGIKNEMIDTKNGSNIINISVAVNRYVKREELTDWHSITLFGQAAIFCNGYINKGDLVYISGKLANEQYAASDGSKKVAHKIHCYEIMLLSSKAKSDQSDGPNEYKDDVPF